MAASLFVAAGCSSDSSTNSAASSNPPAASEETAPPSSDPTSPSSAVTPETTEVTTAAPSTEPESTATATTDATPTTGPPSTAPASGWQTATQDFPQLSYIACCGTDWEGDPSPAVPSDPAAALPPGIYNAQATVADQPARGTLSLAIRPYARCTDGTVICFGDEPYADNALGVANEPARTMDIPLDASVRVAVSGFGCDATGLLEDIRQIATGADLQALFDELDAAYETVIGSKLRSGVSPEEIAADITATTPAGFSDIDCPGYSPVVWTPSEGPPILPLQSLISYPGIPAPEPVKSAAASWIIPTAIGVDDAGNITVYLYGGFLS